MIPKNICIGGHCIHIIDMPMADKMGCYDAINNQITLSSELQATIKEQVLCHEIIHFMVYETGLNNVLNLAGDKKDTDMLEIVSRMLENIFWRFLKDNTNFFNPLYHEPEKEDE